MLLETGARWWPLADSHEDGPFKKIRNLELVRWTNKTESMRGVARREGEPVAHWFQTFREAYDAIVEKGTIVYSSDQVDLILTAPQGEFDGHIVAIRQSGRNIRRFLIHADQFDDLYGDFPNCFNHLLSNNAVDCEVELSHLFRLARELRLDPSTLEAGRIYDRLEIDVVAALQLIEIAKSFCGEESKGAFDLGYCVGRLFSSAQNFATLEPDAARAAEYAKSYQERGRKGKSKDRRERRLDHLFGCIKRLVKYNPALSRLKPIEVGRLALADASLEEPQLWAQGKGQLEAYLTAFASEKKYLDEYRRLFPKTG